MKFFNKIFPSKLQNLKFIRQLRLVLWKNVLLKKRHWIMTGIEIGLPIIWTLIFLLMYSVIPEIAFQEQKREGVLRKNLPEDWSPPLTEGDLHYSPNNSITEILVSGLVPYFHKVIGFESETSVPVTKYLKKNKNQENRKISPWEVAFTNPFLDERTVPTTLSYRLRDYSNYHTESLRWNKASHESKYMDEFVFIQHKIALKYIELLQRPYLKGNTTGLSVLIKMFSTPGNGNNEYFWILMEPTIPFIALVGFILAIALITRNVLQEKEEGAKELMQIMGLPFWLQWSGWFITSYSILFISLIICVVILSLPLVIFTSMFFNSRPELVFLFLIIIPAACIMFSFFITTLFYSVTFGICCNMMIWLIIYWIPEVFYGLSSYYNNASTSVLFLMSFFPILTMKFILIATLLLERQGSGLQWYNLTEEVLGTLSPLLLMTMLIIQIFIYGFLTWYFDNLFPGIYGIPKPFYFLFTKEYWNIHKKENNSLETSTDETEAEPSIILRIFGKLLKKSNKKDVPLLIDEAEDNSMMFIEDEPKELTKGIELITVTQTFKDFDSLAKVNVIDNVSLNVYQNQITFLVGSTGAGKTAMISMIAGRYSSYKGKVIVKNYDVRKDMKELRGKIGFCPQQNMLFRSLTAEEHLTFYGKLKDVAEEKLKLKVDNLLDKLKLKDSKEIQTKNLTHEMMRKLHLGIAAIGNSTQILILDELTSGLNTDSRREILKFIRLMRRGRTILLTTKSMDEAILADRIAIMDKGKIKCCGSSLFLKKNFGSGYHLNITKTPRCVNIIVTKFIQEYIPGAYLESYTEYHIKYILPGDYSNDFPLLLRRLEENKVALQIVSIDVSTTNAEEIYLNVMKLLGKGTRNIGDIDGDDNFFIDSQKLKNAGAILRIQQMYGLLMKRFYYYKRRYVLLLLEIFCPSLMLIVFLWWYGFNSRKSLMEPALQLDLAFHANTFVYYSSNNEDLGNHYADLLPEEAVIQETDKDLKNSILASHKCKYSCAIAADISNYGSCYSATAYFNGHFIHSLPISLNYIHNAVIGYVTGDSNWKIIVENAPWAKQEDKLEWLPLEFKYLLFTMAIFLGLSILTASFIILPIQERESDNKHLQFLTGIGSTFYWLTSFLWDFTVYFLAIFLVILIILIIGDPKQLFTSYSLGMLFILLIVFGFVMIPLVYLFSLLFITVAKGFIVIFLLNFLSVLLLMFLITINISDKVYWKPLDVLPAFSVPLGIIKIAMITSNNLQYDSTCNYSPDDLMLFCYHIDVKNDFFKCCPACKTHYGIDQINYSNQQYCYQLMNYWDFDEGVLTEVLVPLFMAIIFIILLLAIDAVPLYRWRYIFSSSDVRTTRDKFDNDVEEERKRIYQIIEKEYFKDDTVVLHDLCKTY